MTSLLSSLIDFLAFLFPHGWGIVRKEKKWVEILSSGLSSQQGAPSESAEWKNGDISLDGLLLFVNEFWHNDIGSLGMYVVKPPEKKNIS